jgi:hypothetical protein
VSCKLHTSHSRFHFFPYACLQPHSEVPEKDEDWPSLSTIHDFQRRVRARLSNLYLELESGRRPLTRKVARVLFMTLEHESWHAEVGIFLDLFGGSRS